MPTPHDSEAGPSPSPPPTEAASAETEPVASLAITPDMLVTAVAAALDAQSQNAQNARKQANKDREEQQENARANLESAMAGLREKAEERPAYYRNTVLNRFEPDRRRLERAGIEKENEARRARGEPELAIPTYPAGTDYSRYGENRWGMAALEGIPFAPGTSEPLNPKTRREIRMARRAARVAGHNTAVRMQLDSLERDPRKIDEDIIRRGGARHGGIAIDPATGKSLLREGDPDLKNKSHIEKRIIKRGERTYKMHARKHRNQEHYLKNQGETARVDTFEIGTTSPLITRVREGIGRDKSVLLAGRARRAAWKAGEQADELERQDSTDPAVLSQIARLRQEQARLQREAQEHYLKNSGPKSRKMGVNLAGWMSTTPPQNEASTPAPSPETGQPTPPAPTEGRNLRIVPQTPEGEVDPGKYAEQLKPENLERLKTVLDQAVRQAHGEMKGDILADRDQGLLSAGDEARLLVKKGDKWMLSTAEANRVRDEMTNSILARYLGVSYNDIGRSDAPTRAIEDSIRADLRRRHEEERREVELQRLREEEKGKQSTPDTPEQKASPTYLQALEERLQEYQRILSQMSNDDPSAIAVKEQIQSLEDELSDTSD